jgi:hypothetical protein
MARAYRKIILSILPVLAILLVTLPASATTVVMLSDKELIVTSRMILTGEVESVMSAWDDAREMIWTYVEIRQDRLFKGEITSERLVLKQPGGVVGLEGITVFGQPEFVPGQKVLLYLNSGPDGSLRVAHSFMGRFSIIEDRSGRILVSRSIDEKQVEIVSRSDSEEVTDRAPLQDYLRKIEQTIETEAAAIAQIEAERRDQPILAVPWEYELKKRDGAVYEPNFTLTGGGVRWNEADSGQAISFFVNPNLSPIAGGAPAEISRAMSAWTAQSGANIRLQSGGQTGNCGNVLDGTNTISFGDCRNQLDPPSGCSGVLAQTLVSWFTQDTKIINGVVFRRLAEADIVFNDGMNCFLGNSANLAEVTCHELGHAIGLGHSSDGAALMFPTAHGRGRDATLGPDDRAGALAIYPSSGGGGGGGNLINDAANVVQSVPATMNAGHSYSVSVTMRNTGTTTWTTGNYKLGSNNPADNLIWGVNRIDMPSSVGPGSSATFSFIVTAPASAGRYDFQWRMLQEGSGYFGAPSANVALDVVGNSGSVSITTINLPNATRGRSYNTTLRATGGTPPYRWGVIGGVFPPGLSLSQSGDLTGTPTVAGTYSFSVQVFDNTGSQNGTDAKRISLTVVETSGNPGIFPAVTRVRVKGSKKLFVYGQNFSQQSLILLNGKALTPKTFAREGGDDRLFFKGKLGLRAQGANVVVVVNGDNSSAPFIF